MSGWLAGWRRIVSVVLLLNIGVKHHTLGCSHKNWYTFGIINGITTILAIFEHFKLSLITIISFSSRQKLFAKIKPATVRMSVLMFDIKNNLKSNNEVNILTDTNDVGSCWSVRQSLITYLATKHSQGTSGQSLSDILIFS